MNDNKNNKKIKTHNTRVAHRSHSLSVSYGAVALSNREFGNRINIVRQPYKFTNRNRKYVSNNIMDFFKWMFVVFGFVVVVLLYQTSSFYLIIVFIS